MEIQNPTVEGGCVWRWRCAVFWVKVRMEATGREDHPGRGGAGAEEGLGRCRGLAVFSIWEGKASQPKGQHREKKEDGGQEEAAEANRRKELRGPRA